MSATVTLPSAKIVADITHLLKSFEALHAARL